MAEEPHSQREAALMRELLEEQINTRFIEITTRLDAMDAALKLAEEFPTAIDKAVGHLRELHDQRFAALETLLEARAGAEKEARDKAETNVAGQIRQLETTHESRNETLRTSLAAVKEHLTRIDGQATGASATWGWLIGIAGLVTAILAVAIRVQW